MHTPSRPQPLRLYQRREQQHPIVAGRAAGFQGREPLRHHAIYLGSDGHMGELGDALWYRRYSSSIYGPLMAGLWTVHMYVCGEPVHINAVQDDFGTLVAVVPQ
jgi:hypothetical protein